MRQASCILLAILVLFFAWRARGPDTMVPVDRISLRTGWADESTCVQCHLQAEDFWKTGHAHTLAPADTQPSLALLETFGEERDRTDASLQIHVEGGQILARHSGELGESDLVLDWCFGSGHNARTWVGLLNDARGATDMCEFRWTWFRDIDGFDVTPGQPREGVRGYFQPLGVLHDHPKTRKCFGCHSTRLSVEEGHLDTTRLMPGVTCQRCHGPQQQHVESGGEIVTGSLTDLDRDDSIRLCAQCHRHPDELDPAEITVDNREIVRFQPIGLSRSPCFQESQMTCLTCHDPHRPLDEQDSLGIWQCVQCHDSQHSEQVSCAAGHLDDCLRCHMPAVRMDDPLLFTDHWIRIRQTDAISP